MTLLKMASGNTFVQNAALSDLLIVVILGWILIPIWSRYIDNLSFNTLKLSKDSTYQTFVIALISTALFLVFVYSFDTPQGNLIQNTGTFNSPIPLESLP